LLIYRPLGRRTCASSFIWTVTGILVLVTLPTAPRSARSTFYGPR